MKQFLFIGSFLVMSIWANAQTPDFNPMIDAIKAGNAQSLANFFDANLEVTVIDRDDRYDKAAATKIVSDFFVNNKPSSCSLVHKGMSDDKSSHYAIGNMTSGGTNFRVYIYVKNSGGRFLIQEFRIEKG